MNITIKNIPEEIYKKLKESARLNHRSMNGEIIYCLEKVLFQQKCLSSNFVSERLERAKILRQETSNSNLTEDFLNEAKREGFS
jgi:plasmid stability protein